MDDKAFIANFAAQETARINQTLKDMMARGTPPTEEEKNAILADIERTLERIKSAVANMVEDDNDQIT